MSEPAQQPDGLDVVIDRAVAATEAGRKEAIEAWSRGCDLYASYFAALAKSRGPAEVLAAYADFLTGGVDAMAKTAASLPRLGEAAGKRLAA